MDAFKHAAIPVVADARVAIEELQQLLAGHSTTADYRERIDNAPHRVDRGNRSGYDPVGAASPMAQAEVISIVNAVSQPKDVVVCAAGSMPGELHKLWRTRDPHGYHVEYGYSCMGYEIAGGLGVKMAAPDRQVYVMVGDGSYLMMAQEIVTSVQEGFPLIIVLVDSGGFASIGALSRSVGSGGFGTDYRFRNARAAGRWTAPHCRSILARMPSRSARGSSARTTVPRSSRRLPARARGSHGGGARRRSIRPRACPGYGCWWDVPVAEVSEQPSVQTARAEYEQGTKKQRWFL